MKEIVEIREKEDSATLQFDLSLEVKNVKAAAPAQIIDGDSKRSSFAGFRINSNVEQIPDNKLAVPQQASLTPTTGSFGAFKMGQADKAVPASEVKSTFGKFSMRNIEEGDETAQQQKNATDSQAVPSRSAFKNFSMGGGNGGK